MKDEEFYRLREGDIVQHVGTGQAWIVVGRYDGIYVMIRQQFCTNPDEWVKIDKPETEPILNIDGKRYLVGVREL